MRIGSTEAALGRCTSGVVAPAFRKLMICCNHRSESRSGSYVGAAACAELPGSYLLVILRVEHLVTLEDLHFAFYRDRRCLELDQCSNIDRAPCASLAVSVCFRCLLRLAGID